jgi:signal transduction histidine kinase
MKSFVITILRKIKELIYRYPIIAAAIVIYGYYLLTTLNLFETRTTKKSVLDYVLQFDSLIFMWLAAVAYVQILKIQKEHQAESNRRSEIEKQFETQKIHTKVINEITALLQDNVNNPLAVISITSKEIRRKFEKDTDIIRWLDRIDSSMQRIHNTIRDIQLYETQKMVDESFQKLAEEK